MQDVEHRAEWRKCKSLGKVRKSRQIQALQIWAQSSRLILYLLIKSIWTNETLGSLLCLLHLKQKKKRKEKKTPQNSFQTNWTHVSFRAWLSVFIPGLTEENLKGSLDVPRLCGPAKVHLQFRCKVTESIQIRDRVIIRPLSGLT